jgi:hypothetical protein
MVPSRIDASFSINSSISFRGVHVQHVRNEKGDIISFDGLVHDITDHTILEEEVQKQQESLIATNKVLEKRVEQSINALLSKVVETYTLRASKTC